MRNTRKGFTLIELLIVIGILATLSAAMSVSASKATTAAKASAIYTNISNIKTAAALYQMQEGNGFKEINVSADALKNADLVDVAEYSKVNKATTTGTGNKATTKIEQTDGTIVYAIVPGTAAGAGAYVICKFSDESDAMDIAKALAGYKGIRVDLTNKTVGAFLYHNTAITKGTAAYDVAFTYPTTTTP